MGYKDLNQDNYILLRNSCLFDEDRYLKYYLNNDKSINPIFHFLLDGCELGCNPNSIFDCEFYIQKHKDVALKEINPLIHYIKYGKKENRIVSPTFQLTELSLEEELFYGTEHDPLMIRGIEKIRELNLFDDNFYLNSYDDVKEANVNPLIHYLKIGADEKRNPSAQFNTKFYLNKYRKVKKANINPLIHYATNNSNDNIYFINENEEFNSLNNENKINYLNDKIQELNLKFEKQSKEYDTILESNNELLGYIFINKNIKAEGILRLIQLQTFEMLKFIVKICENNNITYWLDYGSLLGAIRHQGFVPWDDEMDIAMPREDYEKFIKILIPIIEDNDLLRDRIKLQIASRSLRNIKKLGLFPSPGIQFVDKKPLANVDIHVLDYYDVNPKNAKQLFENHSFFRKIRSKLGRNVQNCSENQIEELFIKYAKDVGITYEETKFMGYSIDLAYRAPTFVDNIYPLKKVSFEGSMFNAPNNPINYLSDSYYTGDLMKLPKVVHHHSRVETVKNQMKNKNVCNELNKALSIWRFINNVY